MEKDSEKKINLEFNSLLVLYKHYKDYLLPLGVILACVLVLFFIVIPQFQQYLGLQGELKNQTQKLDVLKNNYIFLANLDSSQAETNLDVLSLALPSEKDFSGIMNAISYVSAKTGVAVGDFEFSLGSLSGNSSQGVSAYPSVSININLIGNTQSVIQFVQELYKTAPLSEVTNIKTGENAATVTVLFYYKPFLQQSVDNSVPITGLSAKDMALIKTISTWNNSSNQPQIPLIPSLSGESTPAATLSNGSSPF